MDPNPRAWNQNGSYSEYMMQASAQEFVPKNVPSQLNEWHHQNVHQNVGPAESTGYMYAANAPIRQFVPNQQYQIASSLQRPPQHIFQQHPRQHQSYHQPQPMHQRHFQQPQQYMMNNSRQEFNQHGGPSNVNNRLNHRSDGHHHNLNQPQQHKQTETEQVALDYLTEVVTKLNDNPGMFENFQKKLSEMFSDLANNHFVISNAIEIIFEQSVNEQNFRYTGARLCLILDRLDDSPDSTFRSLLLMKMDYQHSELAQFMQNDQRRVRGTTLFLAELFVQLRISDDNRSNLETSRFVINSIMLLLSKSGPENVKCVCQTLKLSGYELQKERPLEIEEAINQLNVISEEQNIQTKRLIQSVVDLYSENWGRKDDEELESRAPLPENYTDSPVFYGPDGQIITEEESSFLTANMENYELNIDEIIDDDSDELAEEDEPEMDLEIQMAFKEFVQSGKNQHNEKK